MFCERAVSKVKIQTHTYMHLGSKVTSEACFLFRQRGKTVH